MDSRALELRFLEQARRGRGAWRVRQRHGLYALVLGALGIAWVVPRLLPTPGDAALLLAVEAMAAVALFVLGFATWHYARMMEGAAVHVDPPPT